ncbi:putative ribonuclease H-like domain-containing protein [Tanacetum coccineum]
MKFGIKTLNTTRQNFSKAAVLVNTARPINTTYPRPTVNSARIASNIFNRAHTHVRRPFNKSTTNKNNNLKEKVNIVKENVTTAGPKVVVSDKKGNEANVVKASAYLSQHMTGNKSYLSDYEEIDGGFVAFRGDPKGGRITSKGIENLIDLKVKVIRCDNGTEFKNKVTNQFCEMKGIKREFSVARTPQQNGITCNINGKADESGSCRIPIQYKAYRVFNNRTRIVEENLHVKFSEEIPNIAGNGPNWLFDIDVLTIYMSYKPVVAGNQTNDNACTKENIDAGQDGKKIVPDQKYILLPLLTSDPSLSKSSKDSPDARFKPSGEEEKIDSEHQENEDSDVPNTEEPRKDVVYSDDDEEVGAEADMNNLATNMPVSPIPTTRVHKDHPLEQIIGDIHSAPQTRRMTKNVTEHVEPKKVIQDLTDPSWIEAMQDELLLNKKDDRGIVVRNKARLVAQGYTQEEGINYDGVFAPVARIEEIRVSLLYGTIEEEVCVCQPPGFEDPQLPDKVYKVEKALYSLHQVPRAWYETLSTNLLENGFRRGTIDKTLFIKKDKCDILLVQVYVDDIIFGSTKKSLCVKFEQIMHKRFQMSSIGELTFFLGLQVKQKDDGIFISQDKYVADILKKFDFATVKTTSTPIETNKALLKDEEAEDVDVYLYRSMIRSLMYLTASRPDIMFAVCACARDSPFDLEAFSDSDYAGASLDRKSTTGGCQFLGKRLISWQCKKQTIVANSTTEAEYVAAANCCGQVLWIQNQMLDYGFNFMNTKIHIDNESTICIVKNPVFHSKTKHIEIRHHFIRDSYEKKLI